MRIQKVKAGQLVAKRKEKVMEWYLIQEGKVLQNFGLASIELSNNSMIGILEDEWFICDYVAKEDTTLIVIECKNASDLQKILAEHENFRMLFLRAALEQKHKTLGLYAKLQQKCNILHSGIQKYYDEYVALCAELLMEEQQFSRIENLEALELIHKAENWEISNSNSLMKKYLKEYMQLMIKDDSLCVGAILEAAAQMRRVSQGIGEMVSYLKLNKEMLLTESENDIFHLYFDLAVLASKQNRDLEVLKAPLIKLTAFMKQLDIYSNEQLAECENSYKNYDFKSASSGRINVAKTDCVSYIMEYAGFDKAEIKEAKENIKKYETVREDSGNPDNFRLRKAVTNLFYDTYERAFIKAMEEQQKISPILTMFFNFGFMDVSLLGEEYTNALHNLSDQIGLFESMNVYTIFRWLRAIYNGEKEPSRNEFDLDYFQDLLEQKKRGDITAEQLESDKMDTKKRVLFEIRNLFKAGSRMTYGKVTSFCPILNQEDFINSVEKMAVTAEKLEESINKIREIDYSVLYREVTFSAPEYGINQERIMKEVIPDMILMPVVGIRGGLWQETANVRSDSKARLLFPIFTAADIDDQMIENMGRYRWEICRKIQGVHWNDFRDKSLTSEYCDYVQFYKKNSNLSTEAKEKVKISLKKARNNYREVFVKDYVSWMKYEAKGSVRLNKVTREILITYCPFNAATRQKLKSNPLFESSFNKLEATNKKKLARLIAVYDKYQAMGGEITEELKANQVYYQL